MKTIIGFIFFLLSYYIPFAYSQDSNASVAIKDNWDDHFQKHFYLGFEGTSVSGFEDRGTVRVGALIYNILGVDPENEREDRDFFLSREVHMYGKWLLTSSAEQSSLGDKIKSDSTASKAETNDGSEIEPAFEANLGIFKPVYFAGKSGSGRDQDFLMGLLLDYSLRKPDNLDKYTKKHYAGFRMAHGSEAYFDILAGKTEGVEGTRLELRGQTPLSPLSTGKVYAGLIVNFGVKDSPENSDSLRLYVSWNYDLNNWLGTTNK